MRRIILILFILQGICTCRLYAQTEYSYILFDKDSLETAISETITLKKSYAEIAHKAKEYPNQTIYNYYFKTTRSLGINRDKKDIYQRFRASITDYNETPYHVLVSITPLTKDKVLKRDMTELVLQGKMNFIDHKQLLEISLHDIFLGIYAPMGMMDSIPYVNTKRLDIRIVLKENKKYYLLEMATLTELYYDSYEGGLYPSDFTCCGLFSTAPNVNKEKALANTFNDLRVPYGRVYKEDIERIGNYWIVYYWTNEYANMKYIRRNHYKNNLLFADFFIQDGVGDFTFVRDIGVVNGNFLDFFKGALPTYNPDKKLNSKFNLLFETKSINGIPYEQFLKEKRY